MDFKELGKKNIRFEALPENFYTSFWEDLYNMFKERLIKEGFVVKADDDIITHG